MPKQFPWMVLVVLSLAVVSWPAIAQETQAQNHGWIAVTGADTLREFMSGLKAERELPNGALSTAEYQADGTGVLHAWGASIPRTWEVKRNDQLCFTAKNETLCYTLEKNPGKRVSTGFVM